MPKKTNAEMCREQYAKHREKRLAAKRAAYAADPEKMRERNRTQYAKSRAARVEYARQYRRENADEVNARAVAKYHANRDAVNQRRKGYRAKHYAKIYARIQEWKKQNPDRELLYHAKRLLNEAVGIPIREIPDDLAEAKVEQIRLHRLLRDSGRHAQRGDANAAPSEGCQSGGAEGDASPNPLINQETPHAR